MYPSWCAKRPLNEQKGVFEKVKVNDDNGGRCDTGGGSVRKGRVGTPKVEWTKHKRKELWECYE